MKNRIACLIAFVSPFLGPAASGQTPASADYSIAAKSIDAGGKVTSSVDYTNDGSIGGIAGISAVASPAETVMGGYTGQLYEITALQITAPAASVNVQQSLQLGATAQLDDGTILVPSPAAMTWSVQSGPIASISGAGLATAGMVYQDTPAVVIGSLAGFASSLGLTVINANFDAWQVQYFGANNPLAAAGVDADGTGQNNLFKYIAGLNPIDPASVFVVAIGSAPGQPGQMTIAFSPVVAGRTYIVQYCTNLASGEWQTLTETSQSTNGNSMDVVDPSPGSAQKFYRVQISN